MGVVQSKSHLPAVRATGQHSPLPQDTQPYLGPPLEYLVVSVPVQMSSHYVSGWTAGATAVTSNVDAYYPTIAGYLGQGFTLNTFYRVPGVSSVSGFGSAQVPFEAVFCKPVGVPPSVPESGTRLLVEKSTMHVQQFRGGILNPTAALGTVADTSDIMNKIYQHSSMGGKLICVEINGQVVTQGASAAMAGIGHGIGVDVLFQVPVQPNPVRYVYQVVNIPIGISVQFPAKVTVQCDWLGTLSTYLNQGWKLVEIFLDQSQQRAGGFSTAASMNSIWFFEKEASKLEDMTPTYQGTVLEYIHKVSMGFGGTKLKTDWSGVISEMGHRGWELACIQETPEVYQAGFGKIEMKLMMFFQRRIIPQPSVAPPPYLATLTPYPEPPQSVPTQSPLPELDKDLSSIEHKQAQ